MNGVQAGGGSALCQLISQMYLFPFHVIEQSVVLQPNPNEVIFPSNFLSDLRLLNVMCAGGKGSRRGCLYIGQLHSPRAMHQGAVSHRTDCRLPHQPGCY